MARMGGDSLEGKVTASSVQARIVRALTSMWFSLLDAETADLNAARQRMNLLGKLMPTAPGVRIEPTQIAGLDAEWLIPGAAQGRDTESRVVLYLHGGAYVMGSCDSHRHLASHLARESGLPFLVPEYSLAPEQPYPAAIEDAVEVYRALLHQGTAPGDILVAGDSAGGGLAVACLLALRDEQLPMPAGACLMSPWLDLSGSGESMRTRNGRDPWFAPGDIAVIARYYCAQAQLHEARVSPVFADCSGLPPMYIQVGDDEILLSDATRLADKLTGCGGRCEIEVFPQMWHVFQAFLLIVPEAREAVRRLGTRMREGFGPGS